MLSKNSQVEQQHTATRDAQARATIYRLLSAAFREPSPKAPSPHDLQTLFIKLPGGEFLPLPPEVPADLSSELRHVFGHNLSPDCPPYETQYGRLGVFRQTQELASLAGFYRAFGVDITDGDRRADHLPVELEFASLLCLKEAWAWDHNDENNTVLCREARARFLKEHLARWVPTFEKRLSLKVPDGYYTQLSKTLTAYISFDATSLGVDMNATEPHPIQMETPEDPCNSCFGGTDEAT